MTWKFFSLGYVWHFQKECLVGMERAHLELTLNELEKIDDPLKYEKLFSTCPKKERLIFRIVDSDLFLGVILHKDDDPKYPHSMELVKIINPGEINF